MIKQDIKIPLRKLDDLFKSQEERENDKLEKIQDISIDLIDEFSNHPFKILENDEMEELKQSIKENGILSPILVRPKENGRFELISGHRRKYASILAHKDTLPCIVRELSDDEATIIMVDSNMQREKILPSEKAFAYKMKLDAIKHQGKSTSRQVGDKYLSVDLLGRQQGDSGRTVQRYIRLTQLIPELLKLVDEQKIAFSPAVEISYLTNQEQLYLLDYIDYNLCTPSLYQAIRLKKMSENGTLTRDQLDTIMDESNQIKRLN